MKTKIFIVLIILLMPSILQAEDIVKKGINVGVLPAVTYDTDLGFQYGGIVNLFQYGDGSRYPRYDHALYAEISRYTKGTGINRIYYTSDRLIPGVENFFDVGYTTYTFQDFYGFNGYQSVYDADYEAEHGGFYRMSQKRFHALAEFRGSLYGEHFLWTAGFCSYKYNASDFDLDRINKGREPQDRIPDEESLYEKYQRWGLIDKEEADGGRINALKFGLSYDTRNAKINPSAGIYTEALIEAALPGISETPYVSYSLIHRQYHSIVKNRLTAAFRILLQGTMGEHKQPFYKKPQQIVTFATRTHISGMGGVSSLRGVLMNRVVGDAFAMANIELRWKMVNFRCLNQNFYIGTNYFWDAGYLLEPVDWDLSKVPLAERALYFSEEKDGLHQSAGIGLKVAMNENFVLSVDLGKSFRKEDKEGIGVYVGLNYLF